MKVDDIMTENPACCTQDCSLREVAQMMVEQDCGCIPVVESRENPKLIGVITDRDIVCRAVAQGKDPDRTLASDCMSAPVVSATPETDVDGCCSEMERNKVRRIPVVDEAGCCCGIVAQADIAERTDVYHAGSLVREVSLHTDGPSKVSYP